MTYLDFVRRVWLDQKLPEEACEALLWNGTAFPMANLRTVYQQLSQLRRRSKGNVTKALRLADHLLDNALNRLHKVHSEGQRKRRCGRDTIEVDADEPGQKHQRPQRGPQNRR